MKTCPYCAEEIKDAAIRCRWCQTWLVDEIPAGAEGPPPKLGERRSGLSEVLKPVPPTTTVQPVATEARPAQPAASEAKPPQPAPAAQPGVQAPTPQPASVPTPAAQPSAVSPSPTASVQSQSAAGQGPTGAQTAPAAQTAPGAQAESTSSAARPITDVKIEFTHTGSRYLLGYGPDYFGIWDRNAPQQPVERFPRNDQGWISAWQRYVSIENNWMDLRSGQKSG